MARASVKKEDAIKIRQFVILTNAILDFDSGKWFLDTTDDYMIFHSVDKLVEYVNENLGYMREAYEMNGEMDEWNRIYTEAANSKFHFASQSDRISARRYTE